MKYHAGNVFTPPRYRAKIYHIGVFDPDKTGHGLTPTVVMERDPEGFYHKAHHVAQAIFERDEAIKERNAKIAKLQARLKQLDHLHYNEEETR